MVHPLLPGRNRASSPVKVYPMAVRPDGAPSDPESGMAPFYPLGCLMAHARTIDGGALAAAFALEKVTPRIRTHALSYLGEDLRGRTGVLLFSSFVWNHEANLEVARAAKQLSPRSLVVFGGPHVPRRREEVEAFFAAHPWVDVAARGEGEVTLVEVLAALAASGADLREVDLSGIAGISWRGADGVVRQEPERERTRDLAAFPSPYLLGEFTHWDEGSAYAMLETNRGCPYGCTFCDWGSATLSKIYTLSDERVFGDIEYLARRRVVTMVVCDANFGILPRDVAIAEFIVAMREKYGYPQDVAYTNAKNGNPRLQQIVRLLRGAGITKAGQLALQTLDTNVLEIIQRTNIRTVEYERIIREFHAEDIPPSSDMMIGLPGQTFETVRRDLQFFFDRVVTTGIHATTVMPNAPMSDPDYMARYRIAVDDDDFVESTFSFSKEEYQRILALCFAYGFFVKVGVGRYLLAFLQREHGLAALDFLAAWLDRAGPAEPISRRVKEWLLASRSNRGLKYWLSVAWSDAEAGFLFDDLEAFLRELLAFAARELGVEAAGSDVEAVLAVQQAVMPNKARALPASIPLTHDVVGWFRALRRGDGLTTGFDVVPPLREHPEGVLDLPPQPRRATYDFANVDPVIGGFELRSSLGTT